MVARSKSTRTTRRLSAIFTSTATLATWRLRRMWGMLFITGLGMIAAVMLVCAVPLYSQVALTTGLRGVLTANRDSATLAASANVSSVSTESIATIGTNLDQSLQDVGLQNYIDGSPQFALQTQGLSITKPTQENSSDTLAIRGYDMKEAAKHTRIVQGRLPGIQSAALEVALTPNTALSFHATIGSTIIVQLHIQSTQAQTIQQKVYPLALYVVGLYNADVTNDIFWHGNEVDIFADAGRPPTLSGTALVSNDTFLSLLTKLGGTSLYSPDLTGLTWYYQLNTSHLAISQLDDLITRLGTWQDNINSLYGESQYAATDFPFIQNITLQGDVLSNFPVQGTLERYRARIGVLQIPNGLVLFQIMALVLFFVGMMAELLVERQTETIALLRSRGANRLQIFGSFMTQSIGLGIVALFVGPLLAIPVVTLTAQRTLSPQEQGALDIITRNPIGILYGLCTYALAAVLIAIATMGFSMYRTVSMDVLAIRREAARTTTRPLWQRLYLDIVAIVIAITGYFVSQYLTGLQELDLRANTLIVSPLALITPLFLVIAGILLVLRLFPILLRLGSSFAIRGRGASAMLAFGQMSRAPRQAMRMTLLLALASAFTIFALVFTSSQEQRVYDLAAYQVGADFSGPISYDSPQSIKDQTTNFVQQTHGVLAATLGYAASASSGSSNTFELRGVDADTFARTATWTQANSPQSLDSLMQMLIAHRGDVAKSHQLPALVDAATWQQLELSVGEHFSLHTNDTNGTQIDTITYIALAEIEHIPTVQHSGILFDYQSGDILYHFVANASLARNYLWVKTGDDPTMIASVRNVLTTVQPRIVQLADRRALVTKLSADPLYLDLIGVLALGALTALLLALVGNLLASWLSARNRVTHFAVLRALGTSSEQVAGVLTWEQGITYITSIVLGIVFGALLSITAIPSLVFSSVPNTGLTSQSSSDQFYALQHIIPVQITVPVSLVLALIILIIICIVALWMMVRVVTQPVLGQMLRLNED